MSVEPPARSVFARPIPAFQMRHLAGLGRRGWNSQDGFLTTQGTCIHELEHHFIYQRLVGGIELLQDLVHDGVGQIGDHRQFDFSAEDKEGVRVKASELLYFV